MRRLFVALMTVLATTGWSAAAELRGHGGAIRALAVGDGAAVLSGSFDTRAILWDAATGAAQRVMRLHEGSVSAVAFLPDGRIATAGQEGRIALWSLASGDEPEIVTDAHDGPVTALAVAPSGEWIASSAWDGTARLTPLAGGEPVVLRGHATNVNGVVFLDDGRVATAGYDGTLRFWTETGEADGVVVIGQPLNALAVDPAGLLWLAGADGTLLISDGHGTPIGEVGVGSAPLVGIAVGGGRVAASAIDGTITFVDAGSLSVERQVQGSSGPVWSIAFTEAGRTLIAGGADHVVRSWDAASGEALSDPETAPDDIPGDSRGAEVFRMCAACHTLGPDDGNRAGPTLHGIFGRPIASAEGFRYSEAFSGFDIVWTPESVARLFEIGPAAMTPGTSMPEQRISDPEDRAALIAFLEEHTR